MLRARAPGPEGSMSPARSSSVAHPPRLAFSLWHSPRRDVLPGRPLIRNCKQAIQKLAATASPQKN